MKRYFINLLRALLGIDPFRIELEELKECYEKAAEKVVYLERACDELSVRDKQIVSLLRLVENLRERIAEKDMQLQQQEDYYKKH